MARRLEKGVLRALALGGALLTLTSQASAQEIVRIGWIPTRVAATSLDEARLMERYLESRVRGNRFQLVPATYEDAGERLRRNEIQFLFCGPTLYVELEVAGQVLPIATVVSARLPGKPTELLGSAVVVSSSNRKIREWKDLRNKRIAALDKRSLGGWLAAARELKLEGIDPRRDLAEVRFAGTAKDVLSAVVRGEVDAGVAPTGMIESFFQTGDFKASQFVVLKPRQEYPGSDDFPYAYSTRLYPNSVMARSPRVPGALADQLALALLSMPPGHEAGKFALVWGWTAPLNYEGVRQCMADLEAPPFDRSWRAMAASLYRQQQGIVLGSVLLIVGILVTLASIALVSNLRLRESRSRLARELNERRAAQEQLHYQATLLTQTSDAVVAVNTDYRVTYWNPAAERLLGVPQGKAMGERVDRLITYRYPLDARQRIRKDLRDRGYWAGEIAIERPDGTVVQAEMVVNDLRSSGGELLGSVAGFRDITDRKRADEVRRLETARLDAMFRLAQMTEASRRDLANYALVEAMRLTGSGAGYLAEVGAGRSEPELYLWEQSPPDPNGAFAPARWEDVAASGLCQSVLQQRRSILAGRRDGSNGAGPRTHVCVPVFDGDQIVMLAGLLNKREPYNDNDARQLTLLMDGAWKLIRLRESQDRYRVLFEDSPVPNLELDLSEIRQYLAGQPGGLGQAAAWLARDDFLRACIAKARVLELNAEARRLLKVASPREAERRIATEWLPAVRSILRPGLSALTAGTPAWAGQAEFVTSEGGRRWFDVRLSLVPVADRPWARVILSLVDFTERKRLEEQLLQSQKMEAIGNLAGGVAHDFNNLLTVINGYTELAAIKLEEGHPSLGYLDEVRKAGERASELTKQLLALSRKQVMQTQQLNLNHVVQEAEKMLRRVLGERVELITALAPDLGMVHADPTQIHQVILNLAVNARDAMPEGGKLVFQTTNVDVEATYPKYPGGLDPGSYVALTVSDTGIGMDEDTRARIFEPFFTTKEPGRGTGLGLSMVYGIVKQSGGSIEALSEPGQGATFRIYLPRTDSQPQEARPLEAAAPGGTETVLLVEDEGDVRRFAAEALRSYGYEVLQASGGWEALQLVQSSPRSIELLVTDVVMPEMNGPELARRLRAKLPDIRVMFISGYPDGLLAQEGVSDLQASYLQKPFTPAGLARKVREALSGVPSFAPPQAGDAE